MRYSQQQWTHPSVLLVAEKGDPDRIVTDAARRLAYRAFESGWQGPPFDPFQLAEFAGIRVLACEEVQDARTVATRSGELVIEFNPNRPRHRIKFSICHEIAHTFFPDCAERVRNRVSHGQGSGDDWQLEMLCNMGAAELLMPVGSFPIDQRPLSIDAILELRKRYEVSVDSVILRAINLTVEPSCAFSTSLRASGREKRYYIDYARPSRSWSLKPPPAGMLLPKNSVAGDCTAIGFTAKGVEPWPGIAKDLIIECVGLPPYPNQTMPRVVGIVSSREAAPSQAAQITYLKGDATAPRAEGRKIIAQIVNDKALTWGAGFALAVRKKWPKVQENYRKWAFEGRANLRLGNINVAQIDYETQLVSLIAQHGYGPSPTPRIRYAALDSALETLSTVALGDGATVHLPRLGAGQAGGAWSIVEEMINEHLCRKGLSVFVYDLPDKKDVDQSQQSLLF